MNTDDLMLSDDELDAYRDAKNPMRHVRDIGSYLPTVMGHMFFGGKDKGDLLPWAKAHQIRLRPGEVTLWHGINGHGKSAITTQVAAWLALHDRRSCIASFEMLPERTIERMIKQVSGGPNPSATYLDDFFACFKGRMWIYDRRDRVDRSRLLQVVRYVSAEKGCSHMWIDSLMKCVAGEDDYNGQKDFVGDLCALARPHLADPNWSLRAAAELGWRGQMPPVQYLAGFGQLARNLEKQQQAGPV